MHSNTGTEPVALDKGIDPMTEKTQQPSPSEPEGINRDAIDTADTEGHGRSFRATEPAPDEPGAEDTEGHELKATEDAPGAEAHGSRIKATEPAPDEPGAEGYKRH